MSIIYGMRTLETHSLNGNIVILKCKLYKGSNCSNILYYNLLQEQKDMETRQYSSLNLQLLGSFTTIQNLIC